MRNNYSISEFFKTIYSLVQTKLFFKDARLIRRPFYLRGRSSFKSYKGLTTGYNCRFDLPGKNRETLFFGSNCQIGDNVHIVAHEKVIIGNNVLIASKVFISDTNHGLYNGDSQSSPDEPPTNRKLVTNPVNIGSDVWIGDNVVILSGVNIGSGSIVGSNSVVTKSIPINVIVAGIPAKIIKRWNEKNQKWEKTNE